MVAVVSGNGLGLFNTSLTQLGLGLGGSAGLGQARGSQFVNLANGNLILQDLDKSLAVRGFNAGFLRTYNSRGSFSQAGNDGWQSGFITARGARKPAFLTFQRLRDRARDATGPARSGRP